MKLNTMMSCTFYEQQQKHFQNLLMLLNQNLDLKRIQKFNYISKEKKTFLFWMTLKIWLRK